MINLKYSALIEMEKTREAMLSFPWENREAYANWLVQTFHMVNHSTRLVALAGALCPLERNELHARLVDHSKEERGHQLICVSDLKSIGYRIEDFVCLPPSASLYQIQYYWIQYRGPVSFFGYTLALECLAGAFGPELYRRAAKAHGECAAKFLRVHSEDDIEHTEKAFKMLATLTNDEKALVQENLELSSGLYRAMLTEARNVKLIRKRMGAA